MTTDIIPQLRRAIKAPPPRPHPKRGDIVHNPLRNLAAAVVRLAIQDLYFPNRTVGRRDRISAAEFIEGDGGYILVQLVPGLKTIIRS